MSPSTSSLRRWLARRRIARELPRGPQRRAALGFVLTVVGAVVFAVAFLAGDSTQWEGVGLAVALGGLAFGFASWVALLPEGPFVEQRESMEPDEAERHAFAADLQRSSDGLVAASVPRRFLTFALGSLGLAALLPLRSLVLSGEHPPKDLRYTTWKDGVRAVTEDGKPVRPQDINLGAMLTVYPEGDLKTGDGPVLLLRMDPAQLQLPPDRMAWTVDGIVAYSKICTHAGCPVGLYLESAGELMCPCHQSVFDARRGAHVRYGPASRPLPQLPLKVGDDGTLQAAGDFPRAPGPGYWWSG